MIKVIQSGKFGNEPHMFNGSLYYCADCHAIFLATDNELQLVPPFAIDSTFDPYEQVTVYCPECRASTYVTGQLREGLRMELING